MTAQIIASQSSKPLDQADIGKLLDGLLHYLRIHRQQRIETAQNLEQSIDEVI